MSSSTESSDITELTSKPSSDKPSPWDELKVRFKKREAENEIRRSLVADASQKLRRNEKLTADERHVLLDRR